MQNERVELGLSYAKSGFRKLLSVEGCPFGSSAWKIKGMSDCKEGVQWTVEIMEETEEARLGVNLEGKEYDGWPIATFIENELNHSALLKTGTRAENSGDIWVAFYRDAWQMGIRPRTNDRLISQARLSELTDTRWKQALKEAYACLNPAKGHRGRGSQMVTLSRKGLTEMAVSPHLYIYTFLWDSTPESQSMAQSRIQRGFQILEPIYEIVTKQAQ